MSISASFIKQDTKRKIPEIHEVYKQMRLGKILRVEYVRYLGGFLFQGLNYGTITVTP